MREKLLALERLLWQSKAEVCRKHVLEDAVIYMNSDAPITRDDMVARIRQMDIKGKRWSNVELDDMEFLPLDDNAAILTYRVRGNVSGRETERSARCKSLYMRRNGALRLAFHEQTGAQKVAPASQRSASKKHHGNA